MWNNIKSNLAAARLYLKEIFLFCFFSLVFIFLLFKNSPHIILIIIITLLLCLILLFFIGRKRRKELNQIEETIKKIRKNIFLDANEINLNNSLSHLENEIKKMFEKAKNDINYLKKLEKMRTEFLANVSHELRTPIFAIQGFIETLLDGAINDPKVNKAFLDKANHHTLNLNNLLNDLIDISMIESGEMRMSFRYFNISDYLQNLINEFIPMAKDKSIELIYYPCRENLQMLGDKDKLKQALINLIVNAIKYTEKGKVEVLVEEEKKSGKIIVRDTGIGISEKDLNRIFERFYRVDKARSKAVGGTGLGLSIVKHIIEAHDSKIEVKSEPGKGSEFSFKLKK